MIETPEEALLMIEDDNYSLEPTMDRNHLVLIVESLSEKIYAALREDEKVNHRYATNILISNQISAGDKKTATPGRTRHKREEIPVPLPHEATCWNDYNKTGIFFRLLKRVEDIPIDHKWFNVRVHINRFISKEVKELVDGASKFEYDDDDVVDDGDDDGDSTEVVPKPQTSNISSRNSRQDSSTSSRTAQSTVNRQKSRSRSPIHRNNVTVEKSDDDDDDCMIVHEKIVRTPISKSTTNVETNRKANSDRSN